MNKHSSLKASGSLLERAAEKFDFGSALHGPSAPPPPAAEPVPAAAPPEPDVQSAEPAAPPHAFEPAAAPAEPAAFAPPPPGRTATVDRAGLAEAGFLVPDQRPGSLAEEFRIVKRQLLLRAAGQGGEAVENGRLILVCSAKPGEGKTFCSVNLALSLARERDLDVILADCDFTKPDVLQLLGIESGPGLMDALADPSVDIESCLVRTDIPNLTVLPAGTRRDDATELLASQRTHAILDRLTARARNRIVVFDSPPALSASTASVLAMHAGQAMVVVRADATSEAELREALSLLDGCRHIQLLLNAVTFTPNGKRFGDYYGYGYGE